MRCGRSITTHEDLSPQPSSFDHDHHSCTWRIVVVNFVVVVEMKTLPRSTSLQTRPSNELQPLERVEPVDPVPSPGTPRRMPLSLGAPRRHRHTLTPRSVRRHPLRRRRARQGGIGRVVQIEAGTRRLPVIHGNPQRCLWRTKDTRHGRDPQRFGDGRERLGVGAGGGFRVDSQVAQLLLDRGCHSALVVRGDGHRLCRHGLERRVHAHARDHVVVRVVHHVHGKVRKGYGLRDAPIGLDSFGTLAVVPRPRCVRVVYRVINRMVHMQISSTIIAPTRETSEEFGHDERVSGLCVSELGCSRIQPCDAVRYASMVSI